MFNIVSQQSTARPGCIIELDAITNQVSAFCFSHPPHSVVQSHHETVDPSVHLKECDLFNFSFSPTQCGTNTQLLHVFQEDFILGYKPQKEEVHMPTFPYGEGVACKIKLCSVILTSRKQ